MGKAAERRNENRCKFLMRLAKKDPKKFKAEVTKRFNSWVREINSKKIENIYTQNVYTYLMQAKQIYNNCKNETTDKHLIFKYEELENVYCQYISKVIRKSDTQFARQHLKNNTYSINMKWRMM